MSLIDFNRTFFIGIVLFFKGRLHAYGFWVGFVIKNIYLMAHPT